jgi:glycyl-radical enzyme activating protein
MTVDQLAALLRRDRPFWGGRGGVTFSGGEPLLQRDFMGPMLRRCREMGIHACAETTASLDPAWFMEAAALLDWIFVDIKHMDPGRHREGTGASNRLVLENLRRLGASELDCFVVVRVPVVPGFNDSEENLRATARFVRECGLEVVNLLPFHRLGESKWRQAGLAYPYGDQRSLEREELARAAQWVREEGATCYLGWETPF